MCDVYFCNKCKTMLPCDETIIEDRIETYPVKGEDIIVNARVRVCSNCGTDLFDNELDNMNLAKAFSKYNKKHNLISSTAIKEMRTMYNVSELQFAKILGMELDTIVKYEHGCIVDFAHDKLLRLAQYPDNFNKLKEWSE